MLVLGVTADDKGAQLESLVCRVLEEQGYSEVRANVVGAGGNEVDVTAERRAAVLGDTQVTPLMCEAKAYAGPVNLPTWQKFLGKVLIARTDDTMTVGLLIALNGVNGNVAGSHKALRATDRALFVFEGADLVKEAVSRRELDDKDAARAPRDGVLRRRLPLGRLLERARVLGRRRARPDAAGGGGRAAAPSPRGDAHRLALAADQARAEAEARHYARLAVTDALFRGEEVRLDDEPSEAVAAPAAEPFTRLVEGRLELAPASEMDAASVARLFLSLFDNAVKVRLLSFMIDGHHQPYLNRLVDLLPDIQAGLTLPGDEPETLRALVVPFPSVWAALATENPMITTHRAASDAVDEAAFAADRVALWELVFQAIRSDYSNAMLRGFLYDYMHIAELEEHEELAVKTKSGPLGQPIRIEKRTAVRQFSDDSMPDESGPVYVVVRILPTIGQPWDDGHPEPAFPLRPEE